MAAIHWTFRDHRTGQKISVDGPTNYNERETLHKIVQNCRAQGALPRHK